ncbi:MAG: hypothetical protein ABMA00_21355, partial [Gemmatimonas sp.]
MTRPPSSTKPPHHESAQTPQGAPRRTSVRERARLGGVERPKRSPRALAVSVLAHIVVAVVVAQLLTFGHGLSGFLDFGKDSKKTDRVTYVATRPPPVKATPTPQVRPTTRPPTTVSAPAAVSGGNVDMPTTPPVVARADTGSGGGASGTGNGVGAIDPNLKGVTPAYTDKRVWQGPVGNGVAPGRDGTERLDSIIGFAITAARDSLDSLARAQGKY